MTFTPVQREKFEALRRKHRIFFRGSIPAVEWPHNHQRRFAAIQSLGNVKYSEYPAGTESETVTEPWKQRAKELAVQLTERAGRCVRRNEASWRYACEPLIFARLNADVAW
jgi:hypothetical protein